MPPGPAGGGRAEQRSKNNKVMWSCGKDLVLKLIGQQTHNSLSGLQDIIRFLHPIVSTEILPFVSSLRQWFTTLLYTPGVILGEWEGYVVNTKVANDMGFHN